MTSGAADLIVHHRGRQRLGCARRSVRGRLRVSRARPVRREWRRTGLRSGRYERAIPGLDIVVANRRQIVGILTDPDRVNAVTVPDPPSFELALAEEMQGAIGFEDLSDLEPGDIDPEDRVDVVVVGRFDASARFDGYSISIDYDESLLDYDGLRGPVGVSNGCRTSSSAPPRVGPRVLDRRVGPDVVSPG